MHARDWTETRAAFEEAAIWFAELIPDDAFPWAKPALGDWNVRDLVGHASRSLITTEQYLVQPAGGVDLASPAEYYRAVMDSIGDPEAATERGRQAGEAIGPHPAFAVSRLVASTLRVVETSSPEALVGTPVGGMRLIDYLATRTFELVVHGSDLAVAIGRPLHVPDLAAADCLRLLGELALAKGVAGRLLLTATGRPAPYGGFTVL
ncbi:MAG: maleylpyruvate isomerase N-terminal domain-containing protein [Nocardioidaceae bacterium]